MDLSEIHIKIKNKFFQDTLLNLITTLEDSFNNLDEKNRGVLLKWLEFEFLYNQHSLNDTQKISLVSVREQLSSDAIQELESVINKQKRHIEFLGKWIAEKKSNNLKVKLPENNLSDNIAIANYLGQPANDEAINFFEFLCENYRRSHTTKVKFVNILYFLKYDSDKNYFIFNLKQDEYKNLVEKNTGLIINKFEKSVTYEEYEKPVFHSLENTFLKNMKR
jgi:hypothetical protein